MLLQDTKSGATKSGATNSGLAVQVVGDGIRVLEGSGRCTPTGCCLQMDVHTAAMRKVAPRLIKNKVPSGLHSGCTAQHQFTSFCQVVFDKYAINGLMNSTTLGRILKKDKVSAMPSIDPMFLYLRRWRGAGLGHRGV